MTKSQFDYSKICCCCCSLCEDCCYECCFCYCCCFQRRQPLQKSLLQSVIQSHFLLLLQKYSVRQNSSSELLLIRQSKLLCVTVNLLVKAPLRYCNSVSQISSDGKSQAYLSDILGLSLTYLQYISVIFLAYFKHISDKYQNNLRNTKTYKRNIFSIRRHISGIYQVSWISPVYLSHISCIF